MPSRSSSASTIGALLTASGLTMALIGLAQSNRPGQTTGLLVAVLGAIPLLALAYRVNRASAGLHDVEEHRAQIQGEAFGLSLKMISAGELSATTASRKESSADTDS